MQPSANYRQISKNQNHPFFGESVQYLVARHPFNRPQHSHQLPFGLTFHSNEDALLTASRKRSKSDLFTRRNDSASPLSFSATVKGWDSLFRQNSKSPE